VIRTRQFFTSFIFKSYKIMIDNPLIRSCLYTACSSDTHYLMCVITLLYYSITYDQKTCAILALSMRDKFRLTSQKIFMRSAPDIKEAVPWLVHVPVDISKSSRWFIESRYRTFRDLKLTIAHYETIFTIPYLQSSLSVMIYTHIHNQYILQYLRLEYLRFYKSQ